MKRDEKDINFLIDKAIEESNDFLDVYNLELNYYKKRLKLLEDNKPLTFMKKRLSDYEKEKEALVKSIAACRDKIKSEYELIEKLSKSLGDIK